MDKLEEADRAQNLNQPVRMRRVRLEHAPGKGENEAPPADAYEFSAPIDAHGHLDARAWKHERQLCFVHKIDAGDIVQRGLLVHRPGGAGGGTWRFDYELGSDDEESGFRFDTHAFVAGEYVTVQDTSGALHTYRVTSVKPL